MDKQAGTQTVIYAVGFFIQWSQHCPTLCVEKRSKTEVLMINISRRIQISRNE